MKYRFVPDREDYTDYASGKIFYATPGHPSFPVRLASEIFQRCVMLRQNMGAAGPCTLYDPCCGGAYLLGVIAYLNWEHIYHIIASDVDANAIALARRNLALLSLDGLDQRIAHITEMAKVYGKLSHAEALYSGQTLKRHLLARLETHAIKTDLFRADATDETAVRKNLGDTKVDMVITDIPYGQHSDWRFDNPAQDAPANPIQTMLAALEAVLAPQAILAIVASKQFEIRHMRYEQVGRFKLGKRQIVFLRPHH